jgi:hypothetical protein
MMIEMDIFPMEDTILTLHPDVAKQGVRIHRDKYETVRSAILELLRIHGPLTFTGLGDRVADALHSTFDGSVTWYYTTVKLDLEARGEIRRVPKSQPQMIELCAPKK